MISRMKKHCLNLTLILMALIHLHHPSSLAADDLNEFVVYGVRTKISMGYPGEIPLKDFYVNLGTRNGVKKGARLEVRRRIATYDLINKKLHKDTAFGIAEILVIHADESLAIARISKIYSEDQIPVSGPATVMIGDLVSVKR